jgi:hypothetical protein
MIILKEHLFRNIVGLTALFVAIVAGFFSVLGIGMLFSGAMVSAMTMATALECGKVVATSFLYRYWDRLQMFMKVYLIGAVITLMAITSLGAFGWLSAAYQTSASQYEHSLRQTESLVERKKSIESERNMVKQRIETLTSIRTEQEKRLNDALNNPSISRSPTQLRQLQDQNASMIRQNDSNISEERTRYNKLGDEMISMEKQILDSKLTSSGTKDVTTFQFVADAIGWDLTKTVKWFIVVIIFVFDPLAICLILGYNVILIDDEKKNTEKREEKIEPSPTPTPSPTVIVQEPPKPTPTPMVASAPVVQQKPKAVVEPVLRDHETYHAPTR